MDLLDSFSDTGVGAATMTTIPAKRWGSHESSELNWSRLLEADLGILEGQVCITGGCLRGLTRTFNSELSLPGASVARLPEGALRLIPLQQAINANVTPVKLVNKRILLAG